MRKLIAAIAGVFRAPPLTALPAEIPVPTFAGPPILPVRVLETRVKRATTGAIEYVDVDVAWDGTRFTLRLPNLSALHLSEQLALALATTPRRKGASHG